MSAQVVEDFRTCGLTHLAAVSGTNLTLVVGFLLVLARWVGVRARGLVLVGALRGASGFVLLARPSRACCGPPRWARSPWSGWGREDGDRGVRALGVAVFVLLLLDPWLALSRRVRAVGAGDRRHPVPRAAVRATRWPRWLPRWVAEALAVPARSTARLHAAWSRPSPARSAWWPWWRTSLVAPAVGPATVLGLLGGGRAAGAAHRWAALGGGSPASAPRGSSPSRCTGRAAADRRAWTGRPGCAGGRCSCWSALAVALAGARVLRRGALGGGAARVLVVVMLRAAAVARAGRRGAGCWSPATSGRATVWC